MRSSLYHRPHPTPCRSRLPEMLGKQTDDVRSFMRRVALSRTWATENPLRPRLMSYLVTKPHAFSSTSWRTDLGSWGAERRESRGPGWIGGKTTEQVGFGQDWGGFSLGPNLTLRTLPLWPVGSHLCIRQHWNSRDAFCSEGSTQLSLPMGTRGNRWGDVCAGSCLHQMREAHY